jgi:hypothetical protein
MTYDIKYDWLSDDLPNDYYFKSLVKKANKYKLELCDDDFKMLYEVEKSEKDVDWILNQMSNYKKTLKKAMLSYIIS